MDQLVNQFESISLSTVQNDFDILIDYFINNDGHIPDDVWKSFKKTSSLNINQIELHGITILENIKEKKYPNSYIDIIDYLTMIHYYINSIQE